MDITSQLVKTEEPKLTKIMLNYHGLYKLYGDTPEGVGWTNDAQKEMFEIVKKELEGTTLLDYGCGLGHFAKEAGNMRYVGVDINPIFVMEAEKKGLEVYRGDSIPDALRFDTIIALGTFHYRTGEIENIENTVRHIIKSLWNITNRKLIFTLVSDDLHDFFAFTNKKIDRLLKGLEYRKENIIKVQEMLVFILEK